MNLSQLLSQRQNLLRQARLANVAFAYAALAGFIRRLDRAGLIGRVSLKQAEPEGDRPWPTLALPDYSPAVVEEHFTDQDAVELADVLAFVTGEPNPDLSFRTEEFAERFLLPLRHELEQSGIRFDHSLSLPLSPKGNDGADGCTRFDEGQ